MEPIKAVVIPADPAEPARVEKIVPNAQTYQGLVGGWIQVIAEENWTAYVNEEGKLHRLPINQAGNRILAEIGWQGIGFDVVVGTIVIVGPPTAEGDDKDIDQRVLNQILAWYRAHGTVKKG